MKKGRCGDDQRMRHSLSCNGYLSSTTLFAALNIHLQINLRSGSLRS